MKIGQSLPQFGSIANTKNKGFSVYILRKGRIKAIYSKITSISPASFTSNRFPAWQAYSCTYSPAGKRW